MRAQASLVRSNMVMEFRVVRRHDTRAHSRGRSRRQARAIWGQGGRRAAPSMVGECAFPSGPALRCQGLYSWFENAVRFASRPLRANILILLPLLELQPTWTHMLLAASRLKMTPSGQQSTAKVGACIANLLIATQFCLTAFCPNWPLNIGSTQYRKRGPKTQRANSI